MQRWYLEICCNWWLCSMFCKWWTNIYKKFNKLNMVIIVRESLC